MKTLSYLTEKVSTYKYTKMTSIHMIPPNECITTIIIIIVTEQHMKAVPMTKKTAQHMKMAPAPTEPMNTDPDIPLQPIPPPPPHMIKNKRQCITMM